MNRRIAWTACLLWWAWTASAQVVNATRHISSADGLTNDFVVRLAMDGNGYLWAATEAGVCRMAGSRFTVFRTSADKKRERCTALYYDKASGQMMIGTQGGSLSLYDCQKAEMKRLTTADGLDGANIDDIVGTTDGGVWLVYGNGKVQKMDTRTGKLTNLALSELHRNRCAMDDGHGWLYMGHSQHGMTMVDMDSKHIRRFVHEASNAKSLPGNNVRRIMKDSKGRTWVGTDHGLALFHPENGSFDKVTGEQEGYDENVYDICEMEDGSIWAAMDLGGIRIVNGLQYDDTAVQLSSINTRCIVRDEFGNVWVGNYSTGIDFISTEKSLFRVLDYNATPGVPMHVNSLCTDRNEYMWTGSEDEVAKWQDGRLLERWPDRGGTLRRHNFIRTLMADSRSTLWMGIDDQGVYRLDSRSGQMSPLDIGHSGCDVHAFAEDEKGMIWIGSEAGVYTYKDNLVERHEDIDMLVKNRPVTSFLWVGTGRLLVASLGGGVAVVGGPTLDTSNGLPTNNINQVIKDDDIGLWLGTYEGLVHVKDAQQLQEVSVYDQRHGLSDNHIRALQRDNTGRVWMSTYAGISCFDPKTQHFYNYNLFDNRHLSGFSIGAATTDYDGRMYFASTQGVCYFDPDDFDSNTQISQVQIVCCDVYNPVGSDTEILTLEPDAANKVYATYEQNTLRLLFAVRNAAQTGLAEYSYKMKGMNDQWYYIGDDQEVVFRGLDPGTYTFILRAKLKEQEWEEATKTSLTICITPPLWRTWWAYLAYVLAAGDIVWYVFYSWQRRLKLRNSLELEKQESRHRQELNEERLRFFTNITHELRTPLTLILGPLDDLMENAALPLPVRRQVATIQKSAERLKELISGILEFRKTETQNRRLTVARGDIGRFVHEICLNYKELNRNDRVRMVCNIAKDLPEVWFDSEIVTIVLNNYLSNAIKYTEQGSITTTVDCADGMLRISVADTGYGISAEALPNVFDRYYQAKGSHQASGTGIGLALVKSLARLHEGDVSVESREGQGSCFMFTLRIDNNYPEALHKEDPGNGRQQVKSEADDPAATVTEVLPTLLVVEDNDDIRQYIADTFSDDFQVFQSTNGEEGLQCARENMPDIIVSDIMMPKMNGIEMTRQLKGDIRTSHIPVILLTAKSADEDKEEGYDCGADSFLTKPFTAKLLASRIRNLLNARRRLAELIAGNTTALTEGRVKAKDCPPTGTATAPLPQLSRLDREFIDRLNGLVDDNIMKEDIDIAFMTDKMAMSHSTFYRKVKALTGMTSTEYIRKRRLRYCYKLLESGDYNVNQAAMMTGFNQMTHFRETFKREFGILPSEVKRK
ncbi:MAG: response regulator [Prevotella sp.]|nr:response regulator [Prevotella sp.]